MVHLCAICIRIRDLKSRTVKSSGRIFLVDLMRHIIKWNPSSASSTAFCKNEIVDSNMHFHFLKYLVFFFLIVFARIFLIKIFWCINYWDPKVRVFFFLLLWWASLIGLLEKKIIKSFGHFQNRYFVVSSLWADYIGHLGQRIMRYNEVLLGTCWGTYWEFEEHCENLMGTIKRSTTTIDWKKALQ